MELFKLPQERGESMVQYSNRIFDLADECDLNNITQEEIMAMIFICGAMGWAGAGISSERRARAGTDCYDVKNKMATKH